MFCLELACAIFAYTHQDLIRKYIDNSMYEVVHKYYASRPEYARIFDRIQNEVWKKLLNIKQAVIMLSSEVSNFKFYEHFLKIQKKYSKNLLPGRESNPGLARDRRGYLPLYYRGHILNIFIRLKNTFALFFILSKLNYFLKATTH